MLFDKEKYKLMGNFHVGSQNANSCFVKLLEWRKKKKSVNPLRPV